MQDVVELTDPDAPVKLNEDGILAIHVALGLSNTEMEKMQGLLVPTLDPHGTGTLTREAWRAVSAEWHASGRSFPDFVATKANDASGGGGEEKEEDMRGKAGQVSRWFTCASLSLSLPRFLSVTHTRAYTLISHSPSLSLCVCGYDEQAMQAAAAEGEGEGGGGGGGEGGGSASKSSTAMGKAKKEPPVDVRPLASLYPSILPPPSRSLAPSPPPPPLHLSLTPDRPTHTHTHRERERERETKGGEGGG